MPSDQSKRYCATIFDDVAPEWDDDMYHYMVLGNETCPTTGRRHWQAYFEFKKRKTLEGAIKAFELETRPHTEVAKGDAVDNITYCKKEGDWLEFGQPMAPGKRTDLDSAVLAIKEGKTLKQVVDDNPNLFHLFGRTLQHFEDAENGKKRREGPMIGEWIVGPSGIGKTRSVIDRHGDDNVYEWMVGKQFQNYDFEDVVLINDFKKSDMGFGELLRLTDPYTRYKVDVKFREPKRIVSKYFYITSDHAPEEYWQDNDLDQVLRRFKVTYMK